jgi:hypothetical protein
MAAIECCSVMQMHIMQKTSIAKLSKEHGSYIICMAKKIFSACKYIKYVIFVPK